MEETTTTRDQQTAEQEAQRAQKELQRQAATGAAGEFAKSATRRELNRVVTQMLPDEVNRLRWAGARALPVIGPLVQWIDNIQWVRRLLK